MQVTASTASVGPKRRLALVIGNSTHLSSQLVVQTSKNNARRVGSILQALGYELHSGSVCCDLTGLNMETKMLQFVSDVLQSKDTHALFYFSGYARTNEDHEVVPVGLDGEGVKLNRLTIMYQQKVDIGEHDYLGMILDIYGFGAETPSLVPLHNMFVMLSRVRIESSEMANVIEAGGRGQQSTFTDLLMEKCAREKEVITIFRSAFASMKIIERVQVAYYRESMSSVSFFL